MSYAFQVPTLKDEDGTPRLRRAIEALKRLHGGGGASYGLYADRPAASADNKGSVYIPTNGASQIHISTGTGWAVFDSVSGHLCTPPVLADFAGHDLNINPPLATATQGAADIYLHNAPAVVLQVIGKFRPSPTPPYTITALINQNAFFTTSAIWLLWRDETGTNPGRMEGVGIQMETGRNTIYYGRWAGDTDPGAFGAAIVTEATHGNFPRFLRIRDAGGDHTMSISMDGINFHQVGSAARTTFTTAGGDTVGVGWYSQNGLYSAGYNWLSWEQTT